jgi:hypothetical protein
MGVTQRYTGGKGSETADEITPDSHRVSNAPTHYPVMARAHYDALRAVRAEGDDSRFPDNLNPQLRDD